MMLDIDLALHFFNQPIPVLYLVVIWLEVETKIFQTIPNVAAHIREICSSHPLFLCREFSHNNGRFAVVWSHTRSSVENLEDFIKMCIVLIRAIQKNYHII